MKQKETIYKQEILEENKKKEDEMKASTRRAIKRIVAIALLFLAGYYLFVSAGIIKSTVVFGNYYPDARGLALISIVIIVFALLLDDNWRARIKNAFS